LASAPPAKHLQFLVKPNWLVVEPTPLKNDGVKVSWDDEIPNIWKIIQMFQTTNQNISTANDNKFYNSFHPLRVSGVS